MNAASLWRCAFYTLRGWASLLHEWSEAAILQVPLARWTRGQWGAPCWKVEHGFLQRYARLAEEPPFSSTP
eukprot:5887058-Pyramimonas_sp.AAC.1